MVFRNWLLALIAGMVLLAVPVQAADWCGQFARGAYVSPPNTQGFSGQEVVVLFYGESPCRHNPSMNPNIYKAGEEAEKRCLDNMPEKAVVAPRNFRDGLAIGRDGSTAKASCEALFQPVREGQCGAYVSTIVGGFGYSYETASDLETATKHALETCELNYISHPEDIKIGSKPPDGGKCELKLSVCLPPRGNERSVFRIRKSDVKRIKLLPMPPPPKATGVVR